MFKQKLRLLALLQAYEDFCSKKPPLITPKIGNFPTFLPTPPRIKSLWKDIKKLFANQMHTGKFFLPAKYFLTRDLRGLAWIRKVELQTAVVS